MINLEDIDLSKLSIEQKLELLALLEAKAEYEKYNRIEAFNPYQYQSLFFDANKYHRTRFLMAGNRCGKTFSQAVEVSMHATGLYRDWYTGFKFDKKEMRDSNGKPIPHDLKIWCIGITSQSTREVMQKELFGTESAKDLDAIGSGSIPRDCIDFESMERDGHDIKSVKIKHVDPNGVPDGYTTLSFKSTQQGQHVLMGTSIDYIWLDEEDPHSSLQIYAQCKTRTMTVKGFVTITATPENGVTPLVDMFMKKSQENLEEDSQGLYLQTAGWDDVDHFTQEDIDNMLESIPAYQHDMRRYGKPQLGSGLIYDLDEKSITVEPFDIPDHWPRIAGIDIGIDHPTAVAWSTYDVATDTIYIYDVYSESGNIPALHATAINSRGNWIPVVLPHDADNTERGSGRSVMSYYQEAGVNCLLETFYNPLDFTGKKNNFVEPGIMEIFQRMKTGRFKIFSTCQPLFAEMRQYHRKDGKVVKKGDDLVDAMRYSALSVIGRGETPASAGRGKHQAYEENFNDWNFNY